MNLRTQSDYARFLSSLHSCLHKLFPSKPTGSTWSPSRVPIASKCLPRLLPLKRMCTLPSSDVLCVTKYCDGRSPPSPHPTPQPLPVSFCCKTELLTWSYDPPFCATTNTTAHRGFVYETPPTGIGNAKLEQIVESMRSESVF